MAFSERDRLVEALVLDRAHEALRVGIGVGRLKQGLHNANPGFFQVLTNRQAPLPVAIADQHAVTDQHPVIRRSERATDLRLI